MCRSVPHIPVRWTRMSTSLMPGFGAGTAVTHSPRSARLFTSAFIGLALRKIDADVQRPLDDVEGETAAGRLLVFVLHVRTGVAHGADDLVERHEVLAAALQRHARGVDGLDRGHRVALDAGNLDEPPDRIAGEAEVVLHGDLRRVLRLWGRATHHLRQRPAAIEQAEPTSPWQPTSAPLMDAFSLYKAPMAPAVSRNRTTPSSLASGT